MDLKHKIKVKVNIHNRFDIEVRDVRTGKLKQKAYAENIILDAFWTRLFGATGTYFINLHVGTGTGTLSASRTSLFTHLTTKAFANTPVYGGDLSDGYSSCRRFIQLLENENVGAVLSEVGLAYGATSTNLVTHALLKDMNGNTTTITKTATDIITIYATVYLRFTGVSTKLISFMSGKLDIATQLAEGVYAETVGTSGYGRSCWLYPFLFGVAMNLPTVLLFSKNLHSNRDGGIYDVYTNRNMTFLYDVATDKHVAVTTTKTVAQKKIEFYARLPAADFNTGLGILSVELDHTSGLGSSGSIAYFFAPVRLQFPNSAYDGTAITGEAIGTGNGTTQDFATAFPLVRSGAVIKVDGVTQSSGVTVQTMKPKTADVSFAFRNLNHDMGYGTAASNVTKNTAVFNGRYNGSTITMPEEGAWYENVYYDSVPVKTMTVGSGTRVYISTDLGTWTLIHTGTGAAFSVPSEHQSKRYWKFLGAESTNLANRITVIENSDFAAYKNIHFDTAPANGAVITVDYTTDVVAKDANHVFDVTFVLQLGEYTP